ncbi:MAG: tRNA pseudouridine(38-40) synthase TruA [Gemmatimonas sp.]
MRARTVEALQHGTYLAKDMEPHAILLVTQYDGGHFAGWQRQVEVRTVQGEMERVLTRLCAAPTAAIGAGRTDAGVHAHGQGVGVRVPGRWTPPALQRAMNALLPRDVWVKSAHRMASDFHPRRSAIARRYRYLVGTDAGARSPFRRPYEWAPVKPLDRDALAAEAAALLGEHQFRAFAVAHTAPIDDHHRCVIQHATWLERDGGWVFEISANRFLHHMVRFLVGTMVEVAQGRRPRGSIARLLTVAHNAETSAPAPAHGLSLHEVVYPPTLYLDTL